MRSNTMKHLALMLILLICAIASYAAGWELGIVLLLVLGGLFELGFWVLALGGGRSKSKAGR